MRYSSKILAATAAVVAIAASGAAQAQTTDVSVIGTIIPESCTPTVGAGGVFDYGKISASTLNQTDYTILAKMDMPFSLSCTAPVKAAISATDNRSSSLVPGIVTTINSGLTDAANFGLGSVSGANVGGFALRMEPYSFSADGNSANIRTTGSSSGGQNWAVFSGYLAHSPDSLASWADGSVGPDPIAFTTVAGDISVQAVINKGEDLPLTNDVPIDGNVTLEVKYL